MIAYDSVFMAGRAQRDNQLNSKGMKQTREAKVTEMSRDKSVSK